MDKRCRLAAICGGSLAALSGSIILLASHHSDGESSHLMGAGLGFIIGLLLAVTVGLVIKKGKMAKP